MNLLVDRDFQFLINCRDGIIDGVNPSYINPASVDLRLSDQWIDLNDPHKRVVSADRIMLYPDNLATGIHNLLFPFAKRYTLILASTVETVSLPTDMYAMVKLKTTPCREGLGHPIADWVDPGFTGQLTLMLHAFKPIELRSGQSICQLVVGRLPCHVQKSYEQTGHYNNQTGPTLSWRQEAFRSRRDD